MTFRNARAGEPRGRPALFSWMFSRRLLLVLTATLALAVAAAATAASGPPTLRELMNHQHTTDAVPGLRSVLLPSADDPGSAPSPAECVNVWNTNVPAATRRYTVSLHARRADVTLEPNVGQQMGGGNSSTQFACAFGLAVGPKSLIVAYAAPQGVSYPWRGRLNIYASAATLARLLPRFNAIVKRDGSLALR